MTIYRERAAALGACSMLPGSWDKRFVRDMAKAASHTPLQSANIDRLAWKYRRQMPAKLVPPSDPTIALGMAAQALRS